MPPRNLPPAGQPGSPAPGPAEPGEPAPGTGEQAAAAQPEPPAGHCPRAQPTISLRPVRRHPGNGTNTTTPAAREGKKRPPAPAGSAGPGQRGRAADRAGVQHRPGHRDAPCSGRLPARAHGGKNAGRRRNPRLAGGRRARRPSQPGHRLRPQGRRDHAARTRVPPSRARELGADRVLDRRRGHAGPPRDHPHRRAAPLRRRRPRRTRRDGHGRLRRSHGRTRPHPRRRRQRGHQRGAPGPRRRVPCPAGQARRPGVLHHCHRRRPGRVRQRRGERGPATAEPAAAPGLQPAAADPAGSADHDPAVDRRRAARLRQGPRRPGRDARLGRHPGTRPGAALGRDDLLNPGAARRTLVRRAARRTPDGHRR